MAGRTAVVLSFLIFVFKLCPANPSLTPATKDSLELNIQPAYSHNFKHKDKLQHFTGSLMLTVLGGKTLRQVLEKDKNSAQLFSAGIVISVGIGKEIHDHKNPRNHFSWPDLLMDLLGVAAGWIILNQP
ncbi:MAG: hypothetical protein WAN36_14370 [Calditrichia bacterium]